MRLRAAILCDRVDRFWGLLAGEREPGVRECLDFCCHAREDRGVEIRSFGAAGSRIGMRRYNGRHAQMLGAYIYPALDGVVVERSEHDVLFSGGLVGFELAWYLGSEALI